MKEKRIDRVIAGIEKSRKEMREGKVVPLSVFQNMNHCNLSLIKSILRILGLLIIIADSTVGIALLVLAELLGIAEELV